MRRRLGSRLASVSGARPGALRSLPLPSKIALGFLAVLILAAALASVISPFDPLATGSPVQPPSAEHWMGTDSVGRDVFSRLLHGARSSLLIGLCATAAALVVAAVLGSFAATAAKLPSEVVMRILDVIMAFPGIALAAVFVAVFGTSLPVIIFAIAFLYVPQLARVVRANVLAQFGEDYVAASQVMGASTAWILFKHVARNCLAPIMVFATVLVADAIVFEASLSFINAGVQPPSPSWGNIMSEGKAVLLAGYWWPTFFPGVAILLTVLALNILSEGLTDTLASPRIKASVDVDADERAQEKILEEAEQSPVVEDARAVARPAADEQPGAERAGAERAGGAVVERSEAEPSVDEGAVPAEDVLGATDADTARQVLHDSLRRLREAEQARGERPEPASGAPILQVRNLRVAFPEAHGDVDIVDDVSFSVRPGETMGLVGESGSGKSVTSLAIMGLLPRTARVSGEVLLDGRNVLDLGSKQLNALRGHDVAMIYQDALSSLNPSMLIRSQMKQLTSRGGTRSAEELLELVGLEPARTLSSYPHELSGGQRQRVLIAMALTRDPRLVIADEPTTALDVTVQRQVVELLERLREELGFAMVFVSHDLALVSQLAHRITVMYAGQVVEQGSTAQILTDPRHEYTRGLLGSVLSIEARAERLLQVPGTVPSPREFATGDRFAPRSQDPSARPDVRPRLVAIEERELAGASAGPRAGEHLVATIDRVPAALSFDGAPDPSAQRTAPTTGGSPRPASQTDDRGVRS
ncbi:dipeptide/oligopeptide/nickel ABC transporter permease/ATP-binding protein [Brachybacterium sp. MASK1Z-5]|uniref:Dipeptide/oligopeptide/nickel ABC transporter permease/ATP-binding protein n=1 Tax=Brachybacterium halotolerans TaxID=2795215 RepID=A0ABS1B8Z1_9MICO|nr:dipeptide/oligopeptide/nickel ABC transporter permease/ATP-binding protein [Brachybacterium halotolerans]MBK0331091.1 dipeptide/oligopeptide/nickel ABC transporter permease/ATP-binding protein [Brachybacterium halotolerans]